MMRYFSAVAALFAFCLNSSHSEEKIDMDSKKVLIAVYSYSGNTRAMAEQIQEITGGELFEIVPVNAYPEKYQACVDQAKEEINAGFKPELKNKIEDISQYDIIFVGTPNWWYTMAPPVATFLSSYDLSGKTVVPFVTHGGGGMARCETDMKKLAEKARFSPALAISGRRVKNSRDQVAKWIQQHFTVNR